MDLKSRAVSGMVWVAWGSGAIAILKVVVLVLLTRLLSPADFGLVGAALVVIGFSLTFSQLGLGPALVQRPRLEPHHVSTAFLASTVFGLVMAGIVWLLAQEIAEFFRMDQLAPVVRSLAFLFPLAGISSVADNLLQRELRFRLLAKLEVLTYGVGYGLAGVVLASLGWGVWALVAAHLTQASLRTAMLLGASRPPLGPRPSWNAFRELMTFGAGQSLGRIGVFLANQADNLVVGRWLGAVALGLYSRAYQLMAVPTALLGDVLDRVLFPTMARVQDDRRRLASAYLQGTAFVVLVTLPAGVLMALLAPDLVVVAFGRRWEALIPPFQVLAVGMLFRTGYRLSDSLSRATGRVYRRAWRQAFYAALVFLGALVGQNWGITGVAVGVLCALFLNYLLMAHLSLSLVGTSWLEFARVQLPGVWLTVVMGSVTLAAMMGMRHLGFPPLARLVIGSVVAVAAAAFVAWLAPTIALGEYGIRIRDTLRTYLLARLRPARLRGPA